MTERRSASEEKTAQLIAELFAQPPTNHADLTWRLRQMDAPLARRLLVDMFERRALNRDQIELFAETLTRLGPGQERARLIRLALKPFHSADERLAALAVLAQDDPTRILELSHRLSPEESMALADATLHVILADGQPETLGETVTQLLIDAPDDDARRQCLEHLEHLRHQTGTSAASVYQGPLRAEGLRPLWPDMVDALVHEPEPEALELLEQLKTETQDALWQRQLQKAILKCHTEAIHPDAPAEQPEGYALVGNCDGQSAFPLIGVFTHADGTSTLASLVIRAAGDIRDGFRLPRQPAEERDDYLEAMGSADSTALVRVPLMAVVPLVVDAERRTRGQGRGVPQDAKESVRLFTQLRGVHPAPSTEPPQATTEITAEAVSALFEDEVYDGWRFDAGDLAAVGLLKVSADAHDEALLATTLSNLQGTPFQSRLVAMTAFMAQWHHWRGESAASALCHGLSEQLTDDFAHSPLSRLMLLRGLEDLAARGTPTARLTDALGGAMLRQSLKAEFFGTTERPTARDLARLDFTEAAYIALSTLQAGLAAEHRLRETELRHVAWLAGRGAGDLAQHLPTRAQMTHEAFRAELTEAVAEATGATQEAREALLEGVLARLDEFKANVCAGCARHCLKRPDADRTADFFSTIHPAQR
ncbi:MAG: hypothetical protein ACE366_20755 [Bradymonadia bacterium]